MFHFDLCTVKLQAIMNPEKLFESGKGDIARVIDKLSLSSTQKRELELQLLLALYKHTEQEVQLRAEILAAEMGGNWLQRSWRPLVMLAFTGVVVAGAFIDIPMLKEDSQFWNILQIGVGGYVVGRSMEGISQKLLKAKWRR